MRARLADWTAAAKMTLVLVGIVWAAAVSADTWDYDFNDTGDWPGWLVWDSFDWEIANDALNYVSPWPGTWQYAWQIDVDSDFDFAVRMKVTDVNPLSPGTGAIFLRGSAEPDSDAEADWVWGYSLRYTNAGDVAVIYNEGYLEHHYLMKWRRLPEIVQTNDGWVVLRAVFSGPRLEFFINGVSVLAIKHRAIDYYHCIGMGCLFAGPLGGCAIDHASMAKVSDLPDFVTVRGRVLDSSGWGIANARVTFEGSGLAFTDARGRYFKSLPVGYNGASRVVKKGYTFFPTRRKYNGVKADVNGKNFRDR